DPVGGRLRAPGHGRLAGVRRPRGAAGLRVYDEPTGPGGAAQRARAGPRRCGLPDARLPHRPLRPLGLNAPVYVSRSPGSASARPLEATAKRKRAGSEDFPILDRALAALARLTDTPQDEGLALSLPQANCPPPQ